MARFHFTLEPLLEARRHLEEERRAEFERAAAALQAASRERAVLERLEMHRREAWLSSERRREERCT
jgi:flagellar biosynthesis chaperone FliJ